MATIRQKRPLLFTIPDNIKQPRPIANNAQFVVTQIN